MRPLTLLDTVVDECGVPLNGRLKVFVRGETATATIYDADGREIANPQPIVNGVTGHQIFIPDIDVTAEVQVLVDEAFPSDDDSWECVRRIVDTYPTFDVTNDSDGLYVVNSTSELRELDPSVVQSKIGVKVATLMSSTLPPLNYRYVEYYVQPDNDGDVINWLDGSRGKWVAMLDKDYVDCRYFGIGAKGGPSSITGQDATRIPTFINRCAYLGKSPYFPADMTNAYYNIGNTTISKAKVDVGTVFCNLDGQTADVVDTDAKFYSGTGFGTINVVADTVTSSRNVNNSNNVHFKPRVEMIMDSSVIGGLLITGVNVNVVVDQDNQVKFENCTFIGSGKFKNGTDMFKDCNVRQAMFSSTYDFTNATFENCYSTVDQWTDVGKFLKFCFLNGSKSIDLMGREFTGTCVIPEGCTIRNAKLTGAVALGDDVKIYDSVIRYYGSGTNKVDGLVVRSSRICDNTLYATDIDARDTVFENRVSAEEATLVNCETSYFGTLHCTFTGCIINQDVEIYPYQGYAKDFNFSNCVFKANKQVLIKGDTSYSVTGGSVMNCVLQGDERYSVSPDGKVTSYQNVICSNNVNETMSIVKNNSKITTFNGTVKIQRLSLPSNVDELGGSVLAGIDTLAIDLNGNVYNPTLPGVLPNGSLIIDYVTLKDSKGNDQTRLMWKIKVDGAWRTIGLGTDVF